MFVNLFNKRHTKENVPQQKQPWCDVEAVLHSCVAFCKTFIMLLTCPTIMSFVSHGYQSYQGYQQKIRSLPTRTNPSLRIVKIRTMPHFVHSNLGKPLNLFIFIYKESL